MSTINKTFLRVLLAIACCIALAFSLLPQAEAAMRANVVTAKVTLNGQVIDNKNAKYPLLSYSNITYFPMTYHLSRFMGVETDWNEHGQVAQYLCRRRAERLRRRTRQGAEGQRLHHAAKLPDQRQRRADRQQGGDLSDLQLQRRNVLPAHIPLCV